jgi:hypothetical protein
MMPDGEGGDFAAWLYIVVFPVVGRGDLGARRKNG